MLDALFKVTLSRTKTLTAASEMSVGVKPLLSEAKGGAEKIRFLALYWITSDYTGLSNS